MAGENQTMTVQLAQRGVLTLPKALREAYGLKPGDTLALLDIGGVFVLSPRRLESDALAGRITEALLESGETFESMLLMLREERERYAGEADGGREKEGGRLSRHKRVVRRRLVGDGRRSNDPQAG